jgi:hypothetical protein
METESDADRVAGNNLVLEDIDTQITAIEQIFSKIEFLENEKIRHELSRTMPLNL